MYCHEQINYSLVRPNQSTHYIYHNSLYRYSHNIFAQTSLLSCRWKLPRRTQRISRAPQQHIGTTKGPIKFLLYTFYRLRAVGWLWRCKKISSSNILGTTNWTFVVVTSDDFIADIECLPSKGDCPIEFTKISLPRCMRTKLTSPVWSASFVFYPSNNGTNVCIVILSLDDFLLR